MKSLIKYIDNKFFFNLFSKLYTFILITKNILFLKKINNYKVYKKKNSKDVFTVLCEKYKTDKGYKHFYSSFYDEYFKSFKHNVRLVFECGIGTNNINIKSNTNKIGNPGASIRVLKDYFFNADIYGGDIDENILFNENRVKTFYINQLDERSIIQMWEKIEKKNFDLIIDDGLHNFDASYKLFKNSFSNLKKGGTYIIEDVHVAYMKKLYKKLGKFNPEIIGSNNKMSTDDYIFIIRKT
ncbi:class I SAM-dependent methyltransferase [Candidatus Pelagibacter sp.]|nr:class I SAM-dependent methyltransferase [Candidatus Pelagibacter sp.]